MENSLEIALKYVSVIRYKKEFFFLIIHETYTKLFQIRWISMN
jgi:hypothetical protein